MAPFLICAVCTNQPHSRLHRKSQVDPTWRWSHDLSLSHFLLIKGKQPWNLAEQKDIVIRGQSLVRLDSNYSTNYHEVVQVTWLLCVSGTFHVKSWWFSNKHYMKSCVWIATGNAGDLKDLLLPLVLLILIRALVASACPFHSLLGEVKWITGWFCDSSMELAEIKS